MPLTQLPLLQCDKKLSDRDDDYILIISSDSLSSIKVYTSISSVNSSTLSQIYLSVCDPADISVYNKIGSLSSKSEKHLSLFSDIFL
jgi:hypothetical protein